MLFMSAELKSNKDVFSPEYIRNLGLEYKDGMVRSANRTGYMRNFLCDASHAFCSQGFSDEDRVLEVGSGIGAVLRTLISEGAKRIWAVDNERQHLDYARQLLAPALGKH